MIFGFFNLNLLELLCLMFLAAVVVAVLVSIVLVLTTKKRGQSQDGYSRRESFLEDENEHLRDELDRFKKNQPPTPGSPSGDEGITDISPRQFE